ncbi:MAG TPA: FAD-dependent monooxygenase [Usitatibacter sp.]|nr:FAD-dependent monooxygenase [Usitatibacter sp.]
MRRVDALVIGAGPAGATAALVLARGGLSVLLAEKSAFPRRKVCGEYISAASWPLLDEIGAAHLEAGAGPPVHAVGFFAGAHVASSPMPLLEGRAGRAVRREILDTELTALARDAGADVHQPATVVSYQRLGGRFEAHLEDEDANAQEIEARVVIAAHGSWERPPHPAAERSVRRDADLLGFKAHFAEARLAKGLMPLVLFPGGYGGLVAVDERHVSFSCCVRRDALRAIRERARGQPAGEALLEHVMRSCRGVREALAPAWRASPWLAAGPIRPGIRPLYESGTFFVGNAAGEAHPLVAEGISMAIQSARLAAAMLLESRARGVAAIDEAGRRYAVEWRANFASRLRASSAFATLLVAPATRRAGIGLIAALPAALTLGARWSGKARSLGLRGARA